MANNVKVKVEWLPGGMEQFFKYNDGVRKALLDKGEQIAAKNSANANKYIHDRRKFKNEPYKAEIRILKHTQACVVHSTNKIAAAIGRKHGLPKK